jgi:hypothetical protein
MESAGYQSQHRLTFWFSRPPVGFASRKREENPHNNEDTWAPPLENGRIFFSSIDLSRAKNYFILGTYFLGVNSMRFCRYFLCLVLICAVGSSVYSQDPVADVFELMERIARIEKNSLWPGFYPAEIPAAVFDGVNTYLFDHPSPPEGFKLLNAEKDVHVFEGQHMQVRGNSRVQINGIWTATSVLRTHSRLTGERYSLQNMAGIIVHEQFHVFQRNEHPEWRPNDGYLFNYPLDTPEMLALRMMEVEAFRRAAAAKNLKEVSDWAREALKWRDKRHGLLNDALAQYEGELQRFEGLAEYIECVSGDKDLSQLPVDPGFAPGAIRHMGYILGRWMASILDRLKPGWKEIMESGETEYLHEILETTLPSSDPASLFSGSDQEYFFQKAREAVSNRKGVVQKLREEFESQPGYRIEIESDSSPLRLLMFFADRTEALTQKELLHLSLLMLRNEKGFVSIRDLKSITKNDGSTQVVKLTVTGIEDKPDIEKTEDRVKITAKGFQAEFTNSEVKEQQNVIKIVL